MTEPVERLRARRRGHRGVATKYIHESQQILEDNSRVADSSQRERFASLQKSLQEKLKLLFKLDEDILNSCATDDIEVEIEEAETVNSRITEIIEQCKRVKQASTKPESTAVEALEVTSPAHNSHRDHNADDEDSIITDETHVRQVTVVGALKPKLPKLTLPKFKGEVTQFCSFWDSYKSSIHTNSEISAIDKFSCLRALLEGPLARAIQGLALSAANYETAVEILQTRFGKTQQIISAHMDDLLKLPVCTDEKATHLRVVYDRVFANVRGLESLGINATQYGSFLIPVIMSKLPAEVRLQIARVSVKEVWEVEELLTVIKSEVEAREISDTVKVTEQRQVPPRRVPPSSASALLVTEGGNNKINCVYCKGDHYSAACEKLKEPVARTDSLQKDGHCFLCLGKRHKVGQCTSTRRCRHCKRKHHQSICRGNVEDSAGNTSSNEQTSTLSNPSNVAATSHSNSKVLLQTARAHACSTKDSDLVPVRVLFDGGSERSYVTARLIEVLNLRTLKRETLNLNTFGTEQCQKKKCDLVKVILKGKDGDDIEVSALTFPTICAPPATTISTHQYAQLEGLELADHSQFNGNNAIDILIGSDYYWDIVTGEVLRGDGPIAVHSKFGWLLSGPIHCDPNYVINNLALQVPCSVLTEGTKDELLDHLQCFWDTESLGITEQESGDNEFQNIIRFDEVDCRYVVGLPWTTLELSSTNYSKSLSSLFHSSKVCSFNNMSATWLL